MSEYEVIEDREAILLKCPNCGKFKDAIAFAPQLPSRLAPDGFVRCECAPQSYPLPDGFPPMALMLGAMMPYQPSKLDNDTPLFVVSGRAKNLLERYTARSERERRRKHRAVFRRRKRGVA